MFESISTNPRNIVVGEICSYCKKNLCALKKISDFLTASSILIACTGFFQTFGGFILLDCTPKLSCCMAVFLMTFSVYSLNKLTDIREDAINRPDRINLLMGREKLVLGYSIAAYFIAAVMMFLVKFEALPIIFVPLVVNAVYSSRLFPGLPRLKDITVVKNIAVGLSWALVCTLIPAITIEQPSHNLVALVIYLMIVKDFINSTLCDLKDINGDRENGVRTIPVILGPKKTRSILLALNSTLLPLQLLMNGKSAIVYALMVMSEYAFILCFDETSNPSVLEFFVDGEWLMACILLVGLGVVG